MLLIFLPCAALTPITQVIYASREVSLGREVTQVQYLKGGIIEKALV